MTIDLDALEALEKKAMVGRIVEADFSEDTLTLKMDRPYYARAAQFALVEAEYYDELLRLARLGQRVEESEKLQRGFEYALR